MKFRYVDPRRVTNLVGDLAPVSAIVLATLIEEALDNTNKGYVHTEAGKGRFRSDPPTISEALVGVADRLLRHNLERGNRKQWELYTGLDFDIVHEARKGGPLLPSSVKTTIKAYFHHKQFARDEFQKRVVFHLRFNSFKGTQWSISFPVQAVMKGFPEVDGSYVGYCHSIGFFNSERELAGCEYRYIGVTKRGWLKRMAEHFREIETGSNKTFHSAWREYAGRSDVHLSSELIILNHTYEQIMQWEEEQVDLEMQAGTSLNMIPGGFKGMKFLFEHKLTASTKVSVEERDAAVASFQALNPRRGLPNLLVSELWRDQEYAEKVICGAEGRLSPEQVREIRRLSEMKVSVENICALVAAKNVLQVQRVVDGITYSRIL